MIVEHNVGNKKKIVVDVIGFSADSKGIRAFVHDGFEEIWEQVGGIDGIFDGETGVIQISLIGRLSATDFENSAMTGSQLPVVREESTIVFGGLIERIGSERLCSRFTICYAIPLLASSRLC